jgi:ABC-type transporter Mla MlaB component
MEPTPPTDSPRLHIELVCLMSGSHVRMCGEVVVETVTVLWGIESLLLNETRVTFDFSAVTSIDSAGLEAVLDVMNSVRASGGRVATGCDGLRVDHSGTWGEERLWPPDS